MQSDLKEGLEFFTALQEWRGSQTFDLNNMRRVMAELGNPQDLVPSVHVAGTNGKGSVSASIAAILGATGRRVGLNVSPHLERPEERFVIDGNQIESGVLARSALQLKCVCEKLSIRLSYHEGATAIAFLAFAKLDWAVIEVGLGGRLDSSNVMSHPRVACITSISFDHQHILGNTLSAIAAEKAGIIKSKQDVVVGRLGPEALAAVERKAAEERANLHVLGRDFDYAENSGVLMFSWKGDERFRFTPALRGVHQRDNAAVALAAATLLGISNQAAQAGVAGVFWPGRLETLNVWGRPLILDCAHNSAGIQTLISYLDSNFDKGLEICFGALDTKDWREMLGLLRPHIGKWNIVEPPVERAVKAAAIKKHLQSIGVLDCVVHASPEAALAALRKSAGQTPLLCVGSMYLIGALRSQLNIPARKIWERAPEFN